MTHSVFYACVQRSITFRISVMVVLCLPSRAMAEPPTLESLAEQVNSLVQSVQSLKDTVDAQQDRIKELESENATLRTEPTSLPPESDTNTTDREPSQDTGNPDIGLVVDLVGLFTESEEDVDGNDRRSVRDFELILGHEVDSNIRLDATISFSDEDETVDLEEAFVSYDDFLWGWASRVGRFRPQVGSTNTQHRDERDTADVPLVIQRYFGDEGFYRTGLEFSQSFSPFSDRIAHQVVGGIVEGGVGTGGTLFGDMRRHPTLFARLANTVEFSDATQLVVGGTVLSGSATADDRNDVRALGLDAAYLRSFEGPRQVKLQSELFVQDRDDPVINDDPVGYYGLLDFRFSDHWGFGTRYDSVELITDDIDKDTAYSAYATFFQSAFARWRFQYQHIDYAGGGNDDRVYLQVTFGLGDHDHELQ